MVGKLLLRNEKIKETLFLGCDFVFFLFKIKKRIFIFFFFLSR